jgi:Domain of unknown function (DUF4203)
MLPAPYATPAAGILVLGGLLACFAGYRLFRFVLGLYGFILGAMVTTSVWGTSSLWALIVAGLVGGVVGALLMIAAYFIGVGLVGAGLAALLVNVVWKLVGGTPPTVVLVVTCVLGALAALSIVRYVVVFGTALAGSWTALVGGLALAGDAIAGRATSAGDVWILHPLDPWPGRWWVLPAWLLLALAGVIVQLATTTKGGARRRRARKAATAT